MNPGPLPRPARHGLVPIRAQGLVLALVLALALALPALLTACAPTTPELWANLRAKGAEHGFTPLRIPTPPLALSALLKAPPGNAPAEYLVVYLEGDGRVLAGRGAVRDDPTPAKTLVFDLAAQDPAPAVLYLARIGQFQPQYTGAAYQTYWAEGRLGPEAVRAAGTAIATVKTRLAVQRVYLVGYSGGGGLACLLAAQDPDVAGLVTLAGLLDHVWWTSTNHYTPLSASLNPADFAPQLANLPQIHFYGLEDTMITPEMSARFLSLAPFANAARLGVPADHHTGWQEAWPGLLRHYVLPLREGAELKYK